MEYAIARVFTKRETEKSNWSGRVGSVEGVADINKIVLNGNELGAASINYLLNFSLQSLQDAYAGAESLAEATANFEKKLAALLDGTIGVRGAGGGMSDEDRAKAYVAEQAVRAKLPADEWKAMDDDAKAERVARAIGTLEEKRGEWFAEQVAARVEHVVDMRRKRAEEKATIAAMGDLDL